MALLVLARIAGREEGPPLAADAIVHPQHAGLTPAAVNYALASGNAERIQAAMPTIRIEMDRVSPQTAAALSTLYEDLVVHYCALTGQDPNSNPEVRRVRRAGAMRMIEQAAAAQRRAGSSGATGMSGSPG